MFNSERPNMSEREKYEHRITACRQYVDRMWPDDDEETKMIRVEAIYQLAKAFFDEIIPFRTKMILTPSLN